MTIKDIARMSGYSTGTVSRVINNRADVSEEARKKIKQIIEEHHYQPNSNARMLKQTVSSEIAVIVRASNSIFFESILEEIQRRMKEHGESINVHFIGETGDEVETAVQVGQSMKPKGIIFLGGTTNHFRKGFSQITIPCVLITVDASELPYDNLSSFSIDDEAAAACAMQNLLSRGHRRIGILGGYRGISDEEDEREGSNLRISGAVKELEKNGIPFDFEKDYCPCGLSEKSAYEAAEKLLEKSPDLTAVFALTDSIAMGAMRLFFDKNRRVPDDISVVGFNGTNYVYYSNPRLATIKQDVEQFARKSVDDLLMRISYGRETVHEKIPFEYIDGESVAQPSK